MDAPPHHRTTYKSSLYAPAGLCAGYKYIAFFLQFT